MDISILFRLCPALDVLHEWIFQFCFGCALPAVPVWPGAPCRCAAPRVAVFCECPARGACMALVCPVSALCALSLTPRRFSRVPCPRCLYDYEVPCRCAACRLAPVFACPACCTCVALPRPDSAPRLRRCPRFLRVLCLRCLYGLGAPCLRALHVASFSESALPAVPVWPWCALPLRAPRCASCRTGFRACRPAVPIWP
jgi:hypothetical protein